MADGKNPALSESQLAIMRVLWDQDEATVLAVQEGLRPDRQLAVTTVATMLSRLHDKGIVARRTEGRQFVYRAAVDEADVRRSMVSQLMERMFEGDAGALVHHLVSEGRINPDELARIRRRIAAQKRKKGGGDGR